MQNMENEQACQLPNIIIILHIKEMSMFRARTFVFYAIYGKTTGTFRKICHLANGEFLWYAFITKGDAKSLADSFEMQDKSRV